MYPNKMSRERKMDRHARIETLLLEKTNSKVMPFFSNPQHWMHQGSDKYEVSVSMVFHFLAKVTSLYSFLHSSSSWSQVWHKALTLMPFCSSFRKLPNKT